MSRAVKLERLAHANALIKVISDSGRRFFWNEKDQRLAKLVLDDRGRVWWIDNYRGARVFTHQTNIPNRWVGFSHGSTLRSLVEAMRDYIVHGRQIDHWRISTPWLYGNTNIWGYSDADAKVVMAQVFDLPIIKVGA